MLTVLPVVGYFGGLSSMGVQLPMWLRLLLKDLSERIIDALDVDLNLL